MPSKHVGMEQNTEGKTEQKEKKKRKVITHTSKEKKLERNSQSRECPSPRTAGKQ